MNLIRIVTLLSLLLHGTFGQPGSCSVKRPCKECEPRDCDTDAQCVGPDMICADAHKPELIKLKLDKRKAYCGATVGERTWEVCFNKTILSGVPQCTSNATCSDNNVCNGVETCASGKFCLPGVPLICDDGDLCTTNTCDPITGCSFTPVTCSAPNTSCDPYDGICKTPFQKACSFLGLSFGTCPRTTTAVVFPNQTMIPTEIGLLQQLSWLGVRDSGLIGTIPTEISKLTKLHTLNLHGNLLSGTVPTELSRLTGLIFLSLYENMLTGTIPPELCSPGREISIDCGELSCSCCVDSNSVACPV